MKLSNLFLLILVIGCHTVFGQIEGKKYAHTTIPDSIIDLPPPVEEPWDIGFDFIAFRSSINTRDTIGKIDGTFFAAQVFMQYDVLNKNNFLSIGPMLAGRFGFAFFFHTGIKGGLHFGINDKARNKFPIGGTFDIGYDVSHNRFGGGKTRSVSGFFGTTNLIISIKGSNLRLGYSRTFPDSNPSNYIHTFTIGYSVPVKVESPFTRLNEKKKQERTQKRKGNNDWYTD